MKYLTYLALIATADAKWHPLKDLKEFHHKHPHPIREWRDHHKNATKKMDKWLKKEWKKVTRTDEQVSLDKVKLEAIVEGVLRGALHAEGFDDINKCITDAERVFTDAEHAFTDFKAGGTSNVIKGL